MIRYFAIAAVIVFAFILALLALPHRPTPETSPGPYASTVAAAGSPRPDSMSDATAGPLLGEAPWALSALPECFQQKREIHGSRAYVRANLRDLAPETWRRIEHVRLVTADCRLDVARRSAVVTRGNDTRLVIAPDTNFFVWEKSLVIDRSTPGAEDVRVYALRDGKAPAFTALGGTPPHS